MRCLHACRCCRFVVCCCSNTRCGALTDRHSLPPNTATCPPLPSLPSLLSSNLCDKVLCVDGQCGITVDGGWVGGWAPLPLPLPPASNPLLLPVWGCIAACPAHNHTSESNMPAHCVQPSPSLPSCWTWQTRTVRCMPKPLPGAIAAPVMAPALSHPLTPRLCPLAATPAVGTAPMAPTAPRMAAAALLLACPAAAQARARPRRAVQASTWGQLWAASLRPTVSRASSTTCLQPPAGPAAVAPAGCNAAASLFCRSPANIDTACLPCLPCPACLQSS